MRTASFILAAALALPLRAQVPVKSYAQELVDQVVAKNPGLLVIAMHVSPPGVASYPIIASNIGRIGKIADDDDMRVVTTGKTNLEVAHGGRRFEVELVMRDLAGENIGALGLVFAYKAGDSKAALEKSATRIRDGLAKRILDSASLVEPHPFDPLATTRTHAQKLVDETLQRHPELNLMAMRVTPPKGRDNVIIASNFGRIGKRADEADARVIATGQPRVLAIGKRYEVELPLLDLAGGVVGALSVGWPKVAEEKADVAKAEKLRDELRKQIPSLEKLVELDP
jgi:hypothetical protein